MSTVQNLKKKRNQAINRDIVLRRLAVQLTGKNEASPMVFLKDIFEEATDKDRFIGDTMFWKYFEDINCERVLHTNSVEYRNLKVMFFETIYYFFLLFLVTLYIYQLLTSDTYNCRLFQTSYWGGCDAVGENCKISNVHDIQSFWAWMGEELLRNAFTTPAQSTPVATIATVFPDSFFALNWNPRFLGADRSSLLLGSIRIRQNRIQANGGCAVSSLIRHVFPDCYGDYSDAFQDQSSYVPNNAPSYLSSAYQWVPAKTTRQVTVPGQHGTYGGDGFLWELPMDNVTAKTMIEDLFEWGWVDHQTRSIQVEVNTLSTNLNVVVNSNMIFEFTATGDVTGYVDSLAARALMFTPAGKGPDGGVLALEIILLLCFVLYAIYTLWLMLKTCQNFLGENILGYIRKSTAWMVLTLPVRTFYHYLSYGWNCADCVILCLAFAHIGLRFQIFAGVMTEPALQPSVVGHPEIFMPFSRFMRGEQASATNVGAFLIMIMWIKTFKYLCMISYFRHLVRILEKCVTRLAVFAGMLVLVVFGFAIAFVIGYGHIQKEYATIQGAFAFLIFQLIDGYNVQKVWFQPGQEQIITLLYITYVLSLCFVFMALFAAVVLDVIATARYESRPTGDMEKNPMIEFIRTYWHWTRGVSLVRDESEEHLKEEDLSIQLSLLPGLVRRKWVDRKRAMQQAASQSFPGMELFPELTDVAEQKAFSEWALPSTRNDVFKRLVQMDEAEKETSLYGVPAALVNKEISRAQLQRLIDEDETLPLLLGSDKAVDVIRRFKKTPTKGDQEDVASALKALQGSIFGRVDRLEKVQLAEVPAEVPEVTEITNEMSEALNMVRDNFRFQLAGIIEATAILFEHLVELTQHLESVRKNHETVIRMAREASLST